MAEAKYRWDSIEYAKHSHAQFAWARELFAKLGLKGDETVLDIGCGEGKVTAYIAERVPRGAVVGIDNSLEMLTLAQDTFPPETYPNLIFLHMDAREISLEKKFDVAFSNAMLHWVKDHRPVLKGVKACLKPSGILLFQMGGKGNASDVVKSMLRVIVRESWKGYFTELPFPYAFHGPDAYRELLTEAGFEPMRIELIPKDMQQPGREAMAGWIRSTWLPYTGRIPAALRETFILEIVDDFLERHPLDAEGMAHVGMVRLEVEARNP